MKVTLKTSDFINITSPSLCSYREPKERKEREKKEREKRELRKEPAGRSRRREKEF